MRAERVTECLFWGRIYWINGDGDKRMSRNHEVRNPPHAGWGHTFVVDKGGKLVTLFSPFSLDGFQVTRASMEFNSIGPARDEFDRDRLLGIILDAWRRVTSFGWQKDFDTAALVLRELGHEVPLRATSEGTVKTTGGKAADDVLGLLKPVKRSGKRGKVLAFFLSGPRSVREAMAEFGDTRSNILSQLYLLQKEHGIGYTLSGDAATVTLPSGCDDPFEPELKQAA